MNADVRRIKTQLEGQSVTMNTQRTVTSRAPHGSQSTVTRTLDALQKNNSNKPTVDSHLDSAKSHQFETGFLFKCLVKFIFTKDVSFNKDSFNMFCDAENKARSEERGLFAQHLVEKINEYTNTPRISYMEVDPTGTSITDACATEPPQSFDIGDQTFTISNRKYVNNEIAEVTLTINNRFGFNKTWRLTNDAIIKIKNLTTT
jgi:hypothetical protein